MAYTVCASVVRQCVVSTRALDLTEVVHDLDDVQVTQGELAIVEAQRINWSVHRVTLPIFSMAPWAGCGPRLTSRAVRSCSRKTLKESLDRNGQYVRASSVLRHPSLRSQLALIAVWRVS